MAFPTVASVNERNQTTDTTSHSIFFTATSGQLVVAITGFSSPGSGTRTLPSGWTDITPSGTTDITAMYKRLTGSDTSPVTLTSTNSERSWTIAYNITGHHATSNPEMSDRTGGAGDPAQPDPTSLTPSWGADDTLWIACANQFGQTADDDDWSNPPTSYTNQAMKTSGTTSFSFANCKGAAARRELNAATEDPGVFTTAADPGWEALSTWGACTIAVRGAAAAASRRIFITG